MAQGQLGHYKILKKLGEGMTCTVHLSLDLNNSNKVALKILKSSLGQAESQMVVTEVRGLQQLDHANVLKVLEFGEDKYVKANGKVKEK